MEVQSLLQRSGLHTVCQEAHCPNIGECWEERSATFMVMGDVCTRRCHYCAVRTGRPSAPDLEEPSRLARSVEKLGLRYCVITSVNRDDLPDGGASIFALCVRQVRERVPGCQVEVLIPDFQGLSTALRAVMDAAPDVLNHNIETVKRVFPSLRPKGDYSRSLELLARAREMAPGAVSKSGMMVGLGEEWDEVLQTMKDLRSVGCDLLTLGQYLRPSPRHHPVARFYTPQEFQELRREGEGLGFRHVAAGPLVRSSYHAQEQAAAARQS
ncbi:MAG: lipoic acid synthetase [Dehalococcoidia bacterium]|nr:lipoic acid synthetase [Dehalococcoidia bacterium]